MKENMGAIDRGVRILLAIVIIILYLTGKISGIATIILGIIVIAFIVTGAVGYCPLYTPLKISTRKKE